MIDTNQSAGMRPEGQPAYGSVTDVPVTRLAPREAPEAPTQKRRAGIRPAVLPGVVLEVLQVITADEDNAEQQLEKVIGRDPGFAARVIAAANSPIFPTLCAVTSITSAIRVLGFRGIRRVALTVGAEDLFRCHSEKDLARARHWWKLSCDSAVCARWIGREKRLIVADDAFLAALLHLVGRVQLLNLEPNLYEAVERLTGSGVDVIDAERRVYGSDHIEVATLSVAAWKLPDPLVFALNYREEPLAEEPLGLLRAVANLGISIGSAPVPAEGTEDVALAEWALARIGEEASATPELLAGARKFLAETSARAAA